MDVTRFFEAVFRGQRSRREPELCIVSYPKSGRTWLRLLVGKLLCDKFNVDPKYMLDTLKVTTLVQVTPSEFTHDGSSMREGSHYAHLKTDRTRFRTQKVVLLVRDPRDILVSCYFQATKRIKVYDGPISDFVRHERYGIRKCVTFYSIWSQNQHVPKEFRLVRYEDMHANPQGALKTVLDLMGVSDVGPELLDAAVEFGRFENMKRMEATGQFKRQVLTPGNAKDDESFKVRRGKVGGYTDYLSQGDCEYVSREIAEAKCPLLDPYLRCETGEAA